MNRPPRFLRTFCANLGGLGSNLPGFLCLAGLRLSREVSLHRCYCTARNGTFPLYSMQADGMGRSPLVQSGADDAVADWPGDARRIVFKSRREYAGKI